MSYSRTRTRFLLLFVNGFENTCQDPVFLNLARDRGRLLLQRRRRRRRPRFLLLLGVGGPGMFEAKVRVITPRRPRLKTRLLASPGTAGTLRVRCRVRVSAEYHAIGEVVC